MASMRSQDITIQTTQGSAAVKAVVLGSWAVHKALRGSGFSLTHIPSGLAALTGKSKKGVLGALEVLARDPSLLNARTESDVVRHKALFRELAQQVSGRKPVLDLEGILREEGLQNLGDRYGKAGVFWGFKGGARAVAVGRRDVLLNVFFVGISRPDQIKRPDTRWEMYQAELKTKMTEEKLRKWAQFVKNGPTMIQVREAARNQYESKGGGDQFGFATGRMKRGMTNPKGGTMDLRQELIKMAHGVPEMRQHIVPMLRRVAKMTEAERDAKMYAKGYRHKILWSSASKMKNKDPLYGKTVKDVTKLIREDFPDEKGYKVVEVKKPSKTACGDESLARFEEGKSADPTKNMSPEDKAKWEKYHGKVQHLARLRELRAQRRVWGDEFEAGREHAQKGKGYGMTGPDRRGPGDKPPKAKSKCFYETGDEGDRCYTTTKGGPAGPRKEKTFNKGDSPNTKWKKYEETRWGK